MVRSRTGQRKTTDRSFFSTEALLPAAIFLPFSFRFELLPPWQGTR